MGLLDRFGTGVPLNLGSVLTARGPLTLATTEPLVLENDRLTSWELHRHTLVSRHSVGLELAGLPGVKVGSIEPVTVLAEHS